MGPENNHSRAYSALTEEKAGVIKSYPSSRILMVDEDISIRDLDAEVLIQSGYRVVTADDGATGWEALNAGRYDLLIVADNMPDDSGIELVKRLRFASMTLPVVLTSSAVPREELNRNLWLHFAAMLVRPLSSGQLLKTVGAVLLDAVNTRSRAAAFFPVPAQHTRQIKPASQWGINE